MYKYNNLNLFYIHILIYSLYSKIFFYLILKIQKNNIVCINSTKKIYLVIIEDTVANFNTKNKGLKPLC